MSMHDLRHDVSPWLWVALPLTVFAAYAILLVNQTAFASWGGPLHGELGLLENVQVVLVGSAAIFGIKVLQTRERHPVKSIYPWMVVFLVGCVFVIGEELSWGQHFLRWSTPAWYAQFNLQGETNIHNLHSGWFIFKPRLALEGFILIGCLIRPLWRALRGSDRPPAASSAHWLWPTHVCSLIAVFVLATSTVKRLDKGLGLELIAPINGLEYGELRELGIYAFLLLYAWSLYTRLRTSAVQVPA